MNTACYTAKIKHMATVLKPIANDLCTQPVRMQILHLRTGLLLMLGCKPSLHLDPAVDLAHDSEIKREYELVLGCDTMALHTAQADSYQPPIDTFTSTATHRTATPPKRRTKNQPTNTLNQHILAVVSKYSQVAYSAQDIYRRLQEQEIACSYTTVYRHIKKLGIPLQKSRYRLDQHILTLVNEEKKEAYSAKDLYHRLIKKKIPCTYGAVRRTIKKLDIPLQIQIKKKNYYLDRFIHMIIEKEKKEIYTVSYMYNQLVAAGVHLPVRTDNEFAAVYRKIEYDMIKLGIRLKQEKKTTRSSCEAACPQNHAHSL